MLLQGLTAALAASCAAASYIAGGADMMPRDASRSLVARTTPGNVYTCTGTGWTGTCKTQSGKALGACVTLGSPYAKNISSIGPDAGAVCTVFTATGCTASCSDPFPLAIVYPGISNLGAWDNKIASYKCVAA
ncbi:hypothetical protein EXIGLDRAFT_699140 [Exidia glandulosa HHB12029]|uniref:Uncharacterized protein n=1 Tax=Exidia glandulosa HHB12029 TaxID=1314781 RepID=A0A166BQK2_EXIGL|nr:hypothetical protein EXIGLDRAFT_699140 [Exidia glandulosa HHB12029]